MKYLAIILCAIIFASCSNDDAGQYPATVTAPLSQDELPEKMLGTFDSRTGVYNYIPGSITLTRETLTIVIDGWTNRTIILKEANVNYVPDCYIQITVFNPDGTMEEFNIGDGINQGDFLTFTFDKPDPFQQGGVTTLAFDRHKDQPTEPEDPVKEVEQPEINM